MMESTNLEDVREIKNQQVKAINVWIEPWGSRHELQPGGRLRVVGHSQTEGSFEIVEYSDRIGIFAWPRSTVEVFLEDKLIETLDIQFTEEMLPSGMTARSFVDLLFGGPGGPNNPPHLRSQFKALSVWILISAIIIIAGIIIWVSL